MENHGTPTAQREYTFDDVYESFDQAGPSTPHQRSTPQSTPSTPTLQSTTNLPTSPLPPPGLPAQSAVKRAITQDHWAGQENLANGHSRFGSGLEEFRHPNGKSVLLSKRSSPAISRENTVREPKGKTPSEKEKFKEHLRYLKDNSKKLCHLGHFFKARRVYLIFHPNDLQHFFVHC